MGFLGNLKPGQNHLYQWVGLLFMVILALALVSSFFLWKQGKWTTTPLPSEIKWTSEQKREALVELNNRAKEEGVVPLSTAEKMDLMKKVGSSNVTTVEK